MPVTDVILLIKDCIPEIIFGKLVIAHPISKIPIKSKNILKNIKDNIYVIPLAWNFYKEIKFKVKKIRPKKNELQKFLWYRI